VVLFCNFSKVVGYEHYLIITKCQKYIILNAEKTVSEKMKIIF